MNFTDLMVALDVAVEDHLGDDATYQPDFGNYRQVRIIVSHPREVERLQGSSFTRSRPTIQVAFDAAPELREGDKFWINDENYWEVASAPVRTGDGRWWLAEVEPA